MTESAAVDAYRVALYELIQRAGGELLLLDADGATITMERLLLRALEAGRMVRES